MMVEVRGASITLHAMVAILMDLRVTDQAKLQLRHCVLGQFILVDYELIDWVFGCQVDVIVDDDDEKDVVKAQQDPKDAVVDVEENGDDED